MIEAWLDLPTWAMLASTAAVFFLFAALLHWLSFYPPGRQFVGSLSGVVAPFFNSTAIILALLFSSLSSDVWDRYKRGQAVVLTERNNLLTLAAVNATLDHPEPVRAALLHYIKVVTQQEWPAMADQTNAPEADAAIDALIKTTLGSEAHSNQNQLAVTRMLVAAENIRQAREARLALSGQSVESVRWSTVLVLALLTQIGIGIVHLERRRAQLAALLLFSTALTLMITLAALYEYPFSPPFAVSVEPIASLEAPFAR